MTHITAERAIYIAGVAGYFGTAAVSTMPPKDAEWNWRTVYGWAFDCFHMLLNSRPGNSLK